MKPKYNVIFLDDKREIRYTFPVFELYWREKFVQMRVLHKGEIVSYHIGHNEYDRILIEEIK